MALIKRVSRLLQADLHAVLDQLEEPDTLLRQAIREMEEILAEQRQNRQLLVHELVLLDEREQEIRRSLSESDGELDLCFQNGQEKLARELIKRRLEAERMLKLLSGKRSRLEKRRSELESIIEQNQSRLENTRQKSELLAADQSREPVDDCWPGTDVRIREQEVEIEMLREKQKRGLT